MIGPALAGLLVAAVGGVSALWITAGLFGAGAAIIAVAVPGGRVAGGADPRGGYLDQLRAGGAFLRDDPLLRAIIGMVAVTNLLDAAFFSVALPVWARELGHGPAVIGLVTSVMSGFSIGASLLAAMIGHRLPRRTVYLVGFLIGGAPRFVVLALGAPLWLVVGVHAVVGCGLGFVNPIIGAVQFERIPAGLLGRVRTLSHALAWSGIPFGGIVGGGLIALVGLSPALLVLGGCYLVATTLPGLRKEWAALNRSDRPTEPAAVAESRRSIDRIGSQRTSARVRSAASTNRPVLRRMLRIRDSGRGSPE